MPDSPRYRGGGHICSRVSEEAVLQEINKWKEAKVEEVEGRVSLSV